MAVDGNLVVTDKIQSKNRIVISADVSAKKPMQNHVCKKGYDWNLSICDCECNKKCGVDEYLKVTLV